MYYFYISYRHSVPFHGSHIHTNLFVKPFKTQFLWMCSLSRTQRHKEKGRITCVHNEIIKMSPNMFRISYARVFHTFLPGITCAVLFYYYIQHFICKMEFCEIFIILMYPTNEQQNEWWSLFWKHNWVKVNLMIGRAWKYLFSFTCEKFEKRMKIENHLFLFTFAIIRNILLQCSTIRNIGSGKV
jgi:hypothetical protein